MVDRHGVTAWTGRGGIRRARPVLVVAGLVWIAPACHGRSTRVAGFWYGDVTYELPNSTTASLGGPLLPDEIARIQQLSRVEIHRAFAGLPIEFTERRDEFWRIQVRQTTWVTGPFATAGEALPLGLLGGYGEVNFRTIALSAIRLAPPNASRQAVVDGIGRGIGRVAVHEFIHLILGPSVGHNTTERDSYEYGGTNDESLYYGDLRWTIALQPLHHALER